VKADKVVVEGIKFSRNEVHSNSDNLSSENGGSINMEEDGIPRVCRNTMTTGESTSV